jgi:4-hydroxy-2-oxovalerate aldolase
MSINILDTTLRDGSNAINFQFDKKLTKIVLKSLEKAGIEWIEMGHGLGLGASRTSGKAAVLSDEEDMEIAQKTLKKARFGFIIAKKFGSKGDIKKSAEYGAGFIRIATNITEADQIEDYVKFAKEQGLVVLIALMKAYALAPEKEYIKILQKLDNWGVDWATLMDSAGTMTPEVVSDYIIKGRIHSNLPLGFHGHNNLQLGIANTIAAIKAGAVSVDTSIGGLGRSAGNAPTEILSLMMQKYGWGKHLDYKILSDLNDNYIFPLIKKENRFSSEAITFGYSGFHSSFFPLIKKVSKKYPSIDYRNLVINLCKKEKVNVTEDLIENIARKMLKRQ